MIAEKTKTHSTQQTKNHIKNGGETRTHQSSRSRTTEKSRVVREMVQVVSTPQVVIYRHEFPKIDISGLHAKLSNLSPKTIQVIMVIAAIMTILAGIKSVFF